MDFVAKFSSPIDKETPLKWVLSVYDASNMKGSGTKIILEGPSNILIEQTLKFELTSNNNQVEYEALVVGMVLALEIGAFTLKDKRNSKLVSNQVSRKYQAKEP